MLKAELHVHSSVSDGADSVRKILKTAVEIGIDVISITDHDTVNGSLEAIELVEEEKLPIHVISGVEISTSEGHVFWLYDISRDVDAGMCIEETCEIVRSMGGICFLSHPFDLFRNGCLRLRCFRVVDGVEVFNAKSFLIQLQVFFC